jgi:hypothetical protein
MIAESDRNMSVWSINNMYNHKCISWFVHQDFHMNPHSAILTTFHVHVTSGTEIALCVFKLLYVGTAAQIPFSFILSFYNFGVHRLRENSS